MIWVKHRDFDELMLLFLNELKLNHPTSNRFENLIKDYYDKFNALEQSIERLPESKDKTELRNAFGEAKEKSDEIFKIIDNARKNWKKPEKVREIFSEGLKDNPNSTTLKQSFADFLVSLHEDKKALKIYEELAKENPENFIYNLVYAINLDYSEEDLDKAESLYLHLMEKYPKNPIILGAYGSFLARKKRDYERASNFMKIALGVWPDDETNQVDYAELLLLTKKQETAIKILEEVVEKGKGIEFTRTAYLAANLLLLAFSDNSKIQEETYQNLTNSKSVEAPLSFWVFLGAIEKNA